MQKSLIIVVAILIIVFLSIGIVYTMNGRAPDKQPAPNPTYPTSPSIPNETPEIINLKTQDGYRPVPNFLKDPDVVKDQVNRGYYYLGNHFPNEQDPNVNMDNVPYVISYIDASQYFTVTLLKKPLSESRIEAENFLISRLGLEPMDLCSLSYVVSVPNFVDTTYAGESLGFSMCEGSVDIP